MRFFFYGTLIDPDVRRLVLGDGEPGTEMLEAASLAGWERRAVAGASYPIILPRAGGVVEGVLARGIGPVGRRRLIAYEGRGYDLREVRVTLKNGCSRGALVFAPAKRGALVPDASAWSYETWMRRNKGAFLREIAGGRPAARPAAMRSAR